MDFGPEWKLPIGGEPLWGESVAHCSSVEDLECVVVFGSQVSWESVLEG